MHPLFSLSPVFLLAIHFPLIAAQTCNSTTGTYQSCCPSYDKKALIFQGREYRVYCDAELGPLSPAGATSPDDCAKKCTNQSPLWTFDTPRGRGRCACDSFDTKPGKISFVPMDSELANDLDKCRTGSNTYSDQVKDCQTKLITCNAGLNICQGQCDPTCPGELQRCKANLNRIDITCPGRLATCNTELQNKDMELQQCKSDLKAAKETLLEKTKGCPPGCGDKLNKCNKEKKKMCKCPKFKCTAGVRNIGGAKYRVHCNEYQGHFLPGQDEHFPVKNMVQCATRCAQSSRCQWAFYTESAGKKGCWMNFDKWYRGRTESAQGDISDLILEKV
ncbi:hypothetical protein FBULB1_4124 [Fusarium bulbicola]|nr:hypothetical protein FBULB1_4124 [Fusarium bulbicola]